MSGTAGPSTSAASPEPRDSKKLSQKIQKTIKINDPQLVYLSERAEGDHSLSGSLWIKSTSSEKWRKRYFILYQNLLFYYENKEKTDKPLGIIFLEGSYVERVFYTDITILPSTPEKSKDKESMDRNLCFEISFAKKYINKFEFCGVDETETVVWLQELERASFGKQHLEMQKILAKHLHVIQVIESEQTARWQFSLHCEDLYAEMRFLREELVALKKQRTAIERYYSSLVHTCATAGNGECLCCLYEQMQGDEEKLLKLRKVQSFFRGWLCRRKWKQIVEQYIKSPHAEQLRIRNNVVFQLVEAEEEYIQQMEILITCFLRPFKMAASSRKPPCTHEDVNSIFLNSETVFFLHQIFLKGLTARLENWPTLVLGDLFSMLLPMLSIYQEYVRNHHYSLQVLTECKQNHRFVATLKRLESKPVCNGRSLETFLTYPMHQIPRYIITLHDLLAHTPFEHVERKSLEAAQVHLEKLSKQMHDEVSETENLRKNLSVERMIAEGCDILLDIKQIFVRQGTLIQVPNEKPKEKVRDKFMFMSFRQTNKGVKGLARQCFLFSYHLLITTRGSDGYLHLVPTVGKLPMSEAVLIEDPGDDIVERQFGSTSSLATDQNISYEGRDFKIVLDSTSQQAPIIVHLVAPSVSEKAAWISDIAGCIDNAQFSEISKPFMSDTSTIDIPQYIRNDPRLFNDEHDIRFSKTLNSCKIPQIRYATPDRILERLTDLRFLSIDFLNTFLLTYRVFTDELSVLTALKRVYYASIEKAKEMERRDFVQLREENTLQIYEAYRRRSSLLQYIPRRTSGASSVSGYCSEVSERDRSFSYDSQRMFRNVLFTRHLALPVRCPLQRKKMKYKENLYWPYSKSKKLPEHLTATRKAKFAGIHKCFDIDEDESSRRPSTSLAIPEWKRNVPKSVLIHVDSYEEAEENDETRDLSAAKAEPSSSTETLTDLGTDPCASCGQELPLEKLTVEQRRRRDIVEEKRTARRKSEEAKKTHAIRLVPEVARRKSDVTPERKKSILSNGAGKALVLRRKSEIPEKIRLEDRRRGNKPMQEKQISTLTREEKMKLMDSRKRSSTASADGRKRSSVDSGPVVKISEVRKKSEGEEERKRNIYRQINSPRMERKSGDREKSMSVESDTQPEEQEVEEKGEPSLDEAARNSIASVQASTQLIVGYFQEFYQRTQREGKICEEQASSRPAPAKRTIQPDLSMIQSTSRAGVVISGVRQAGRRSSSSFASTAFAIATCAADNPISMQYEQHILAAENRTKTLEQIISTAATMRVLNVLRHWISKKGKDFKINKELLRQTKEFLEEIRCEPSLTSAEHKSAAQLLLLLSKQVEEAKPRVDLAYLLQTPTETTQEGVERISTLEIAEQMTYLDHQIFLQIAPEELMGQAWMKADKEIRAPHVVMMTKRFNEVSRLIASEILCKDDTESRVEVIEKWAAVADIVRCLHNFNGLLQICSAFTNASVFRLKTTWEKVSKTAKQSIERHQKTVSSDGRFRALRDALHKCDPPCIPYLGVYLTDLSFVEEGTPTFVDDNLLNFSKMRMISHIIREISQFQHATYKIALVMRVCNYLLDTSRIMNDDQQYATSLRIEPRTQRLAAQSSIGQTPW